MKMAGLRKAIFVVLERCLPRSLWWFASHDGKTMHVGLER
jgi:hypothetical protein